MTELEDDTNTRRTRRIMRSFKLREISAVDLPAQAPALAHIIKRSPDGSAPQRTPGPVDTLVAVAADMTGKGGRASPAALREARKRAPELYVAMQAGVPLTKAGRPSADEAFKRLVEQISADRGVDERSAMRLARRENPAAFEALQRQG